MGLTIHIDEKQFNSSKPEINGALERLKHNHRVFRLAAAVVAVCASYSLNLQHGLESIRRFRAIMLQATKPFQHSVNVLPVVSLRLHPLHPAPNNGARNRCLEFFALCHSFMLFFSSLWAFWSSYWADILSTSQHKCYETPISPA